MKKKTKLLTIHVIGAGIGESIILELPNGQWGVVDCYTSKISDETTNQTLNFLKRRKVETLAFLCLTHPHQDHFRGITHLLNRYKGKLERFWIFPARPGKVAAHLEVIAKESQNQEIRQDSVDELTNMFLLINEMGKNQNLRIDITTGFKLLYSDEIQSEGNKLPLRILCLAPAGNLVSQYYQTIDSSMKNGEQPRQSYEKHNLISSVLLVKFGETMIILGGDAEKTSWDYILDDELRISEEGESLHADLVKVSHHGSHNGLTDGLWGKFTAKRKCHAVIAPFRSRGLPEKEVVRFITEYTKKVFSTALDSCSVSNEISRCSFSFDAVGNCTGTDFEGSAGRISIGEEP